MLNTQLAGRTTYSAAPGSRRTLRTGTPGTMTALENGRRLIGDIPDLDLVDLPEVADAAAIIHRGSMDGFLPAWHALAR
jgi:hypothetical protein